MPRLGMQLAESLHVGWHANAVGRCLELHKVSCSRTQSSTSGSSLQPLNLESSILAITKLLSSLNTGVSCHNSHYLFAYLGNIFSYFLRDDMI